MSLSSYANTGENPWRDVRRLSPANTTALSGSANTAGNSHDSPALRFKNADVIGHPGGWAFSQFAGQSGYTCAGAGAGTAFMPYLLSTLDTLAWR
ncbi:TraU protein [compost metagenome]